MYVYFFTATTKRARAKSPSFDVFLLAFDIGHICLMDFVVASMH